MRNTSVVKDRKTCRDFKSTSTDRGQQKINSQLSRTLCYLLEKLKTTEKHFFLFFTALFFRTFQPFQLAMLLYQAKSGWYSRDSCSCHATAVKKCAAHAGTDAQWQIWTVISEHNEPFRRLLWVKVEDLELTLTLFCQCHQWDTAASVVTGHRPL